MEAGFDANHEDLAGNVLTLPGGFTPAAGTDLDHGTHVAGIVGAVANNNVGVAGVAQVSLVAINRSNLVTGLSFAQNNDIFIVNASFAFFTLLGNHASANTNHAAAIYNYGLLGGLLICAAGNGIGGVAQDLDSNPLYPASYSTYTIPAASGQPAKPITNVISVGSIDENGERSSFSNYGAKGVQIFAPGNNIVSTFPKSACEMGIVFLDGTRLCEFSATNRANLESMIPNQFPSWENLIQNFEAEFGHQPAYFKISTHCADGYHKMSGTSMAAPHVTGTAALMYSIYSNGPHNMTPAQITTQIKEALLDNVSIDTGEPLSGLCSSGGRLNAYNAIRDLSFSGQAFNDFGYNGSTYYWNGQVGINVAESCYLNSSNTLVFTGSTNLDFLLSTTSYHNAWSKINGTVSFQLKNSSGNIRQIEGNDTFVSTVNVSIWNNVTLGNESFSISTGSLSNNTYTLTLTSVLKRSTWTDTDESRYGWKTKGLDILFRYRKSRYLL